MNDKSRSAARQSGIVSTPGQPDHAAVVWEAVLAAHKAKLAVRPPTGPGTNLSPKAPLCDVVDGKLTWAAAQVEPPSPRQLRTWYRNGRTTIGLIGGQVSGGLVCLDFDDRTTYEAFVQAARAAGLGDLVDRIEAGYCEDTPGGGVHWLCYDDRPRDNEKLARRLKTPEEWDEAERADVATAQSEGRAFTPIKTLIEVKAEGGFVVVAPTVGLHDGDKGYVLRSGGFDRIARVASAELDDLLRLAEVFDEMPVALAPETPQERAQTGAPRGRSPWTVLPGTDYEAKTTWEDILQSEGFTHVFDRGETQYYRRSGKTVGVSASFNHGNGQKLWVWSTSTRLPTRRFLTKFGVYAHAHHGGDFSAASKALAEAGYGVRKDPKPGRERARAQPAALGDDDPRPAIEISTDWHKAIDAAAAALAQDPDLYCRGGMLVKVALETDPTAHLRGNVAVRKAAGSPRIVVLSEALVGYYLTRVATFFRWTKGKPIKGKEEKTEPSQGQGTKAPETQDGDGEWIAIACAPPDWLIRAVTHLESWPGMKPLLGVAQCPFLRPDGSLVAQAGYDAATATLYCPAIDFPAPPARPSREDARAAAQRLLGVPNEFPFATADDPFVWLAGLLTALARPSIAGPVPGIAVNGNKPAVGKALLIDTIGIVAFGHDVPTSNYPDNPTEAGKVKVAFALAGKPVVHFDNIEEGQSYGNSNLDSALTATLTDDRILGSSKSTGNLILRTCWFLSGNNITPAKDAFRRWLPCNLTSNLEHPQERSDIQVKNLRAHIAARRGELVRDGLTILLAHAQANYLSAGWGPLGSFEDWDRIVRQAIWFATGQDCCSTQRKAAKDAPERLEKLGLLEAWRDLTDGGEDGAGLTAESVLTLVEDHDGKDGRPLAYTAIRHALLRLGRFGKLPTIRQIGVKIRGMRGANYGGLTFEKTGEHQRSTLWRVVQVYPKRPNQARVGEYGEYGESESRYPAGASESHTDMSTLSGNGQAPQPERGINSRNSPYSPEGREREVL